MPTAVRSATAATNTSTVTAAMPATASRGAAASSASATAAKAASRPTISAANAAAARSGGREARGPPAAASSAVPAASTRKVPAAATRSAQRPHTSSTPSSSSPSPSPSPSPPSFAKRSPLRTLQPASSSQPQAQQSPPPDSRSKGWSLGSMRKKASAADPPSAARKASSNLRSATSPSPVTKSNAVVTATRSATPSPDTLVDRSTRTTAPSSENTIVKVETSPARSNQEPAVDPLRSATEDELSILDAVERAFAASKVDAEREAATQVRLRRLTLEREFERELKRAAATGPKTLPPPPAPRNSSMHVTAKSYTLPRPSPSSSASSPVSPASPLPPVPEIRTGARAPVSKRSSSLASTNPVKTATMEQDPTKPKRPPSTLSRVTGVSGRSSAVPYQRRSTLKDSQQFSARPAGPSEAVSARASIVSNGPAIPTRTSSVVGQSKMPNGTLRSRLKSGLAEATIAAVGAAAAAAASRPSTPSKVRNDGHLKVPSPAKSQTGSSVRSRGSGSADASPRRISVARSMESSASKTASTVIQKTGLQKFASNVAQRAATIFGAFFPATSTRRSIMGAPGTSPANVPAPTSQPPAPSPSPSGKSGASGGSGTRRRSSARAVGLEAVTARTGAAARPPVVPEKTPRSANSQAKLPVSKTAMLAQQKPKESKARPSATGPSFSAPPPRKNGVIQPKNAQPKPPLAQTSTSKWLQAKVARQEERLSAPVARPPPSPPKSAKSSLDGRNKGKMPANSFDSSSSSTPPPPTDVVDPSLSNSSVGRGNAIYQSPPPVPAKPLQSSPLVRPPSIASAQDDLPTQERALGQKEKSNSPPLASPVIASPAVSSSEVPSSQLPIESSNTVPLFAAASPEMSPPATFRSLQAPQSAPVQAPQNHPVATPISLQQLTTVPNTATDPTAVSATLTGTATDSPTRANSNAPMASALALYSKSDASGIISPTSGSAAVRAADAERVALDAKREGKWRAMVVDQRGFRTANATPVPGGEGEGGLISVGMPARVGIGLVFRFVKSEKFAQRVCKGPPSAWRGYVWYHLFTESATSDAVTAANAFDAQLIGEFHAKQTMSCIYDEEIELDAQNALANHVHFMTKDSSGQRGIRRVLNAFTQRDVEFGYNSAMVKIAAMLLLNMEEERAYIALVHLYHPVDTVSRRFGLRSLHASGLAGLPELLFLHDELIKVYAPRLRAKFASSRLKTIQYATHWYVALFCNCTPCPSMQELDQMYSELERLLSSGSDLGVSTRGLSPALVMATFDSLLPFRVLVRLWDLFALYGYEILAVIGVALLRKHEAFLMTLERDDIISFFLPSSTPFVLRRLRRAARNKTASSSSASSTHSSLPRVPLPFHFAGARSPSPARSLASPTPPSPTPYESGNGDAAAPDGSTGTFSRSAVAAAAAAAAAAALDAPPPSGTGASASSSAAAAFVHVPPVWAPDADEPFIQLVLAIWNGSAAAIQHPGAAPAASSSGGAGNAGSQNAGLPPLAGSGGASGKGGFWSRLGGGGAGGGGGEFSHNWDARAGGKVLVRQMREAYDSSGVKLGMLVGGAEEMRKNVR